jgi:hypothetical protein
MQLVAQEGYGVRPLRRGTAQPVVAIPDARLGIVKGMSGNHFFDHG